MPGVLWATGPPPRGLWAHRSGSSELGCPRRLRGWGLTRRSHSPWRGSSRRHDHSRPALRGGHGSFVPGGSPPTRAEPRCRLETQGSRVDPQGLQ